MKHEASSNLTAPTIHLHLKHIAYKFLFLSLATFLAGCATSQPNVEVVANTLLTYQIGKTTFQEFQKDAGLVEVETPVHTPPPSYLNPHPFVPVQRKGYKTPKGSPWRIYEMGFSENFEHLKYTRIESFVVGDIKKPISFLQFNSQGKLINISPAILPGISQ